MKDKKDLIKRLEIIFQNPELLYKFREKYVTDIEMTKASVMAGLIKESAVKFINELTK